MNKLYAFLVLCFSLILLSPTLEFEPEKLFFEITGALSKSYEGVTVTLVELQINGKKFLVSSDYSDESDHNGNFKLEYAVPLDSLGLIKTNSGEQLQAKSSGLLDWFMDLLDGSPKNEPQTVNLNLSTKIYVSGKSHTVALLSFKGTIDSLYDSGQKRYILRRKLPSEIKVD